MIPYNKELIIIIIISHFSVTVCILKTASSSKSWICPRDVTGSAGTALTEDLYHDYDDDDDNNNNNNDNNNNIQYTIKYANK